MDSVMSQIRSVLISTKGKSDLRQLQKDFKMLMGEDIPYKKLGYSNIETFIKNVPSLTVSHGPNGLLVEAIPSQKSKHMVQLINKQKMSKKRNGGSGRLPPRHYSKQTARVTRQSYQKPQSTTNQQWRAPFVDKAKPRPHVHQIVVSVNNSSQQNSSVSSMQHRLVRSVSKAQSPPVSTAVSDNLARKGTRLTRSVSSPMTAPAQREQATPSCNTPSMPICQLPEPKGVAINESRPRMRFVNNTSGATPSAVNPGSSMAGPRCPAPSLSKQEIETLMKEAVAQYDPAGQVWNWSSSNDSSPKRPADSSVEVPPKETIYRRNSDLSNNVSTSMNGQETNTLKKLKHFVAQHNLGTVNVRILPRASKNPRAAPQLYDCSIKVDNQSFSSYPRDCTSTTEAETEAANQALTILSARYSADLKKGKLLLATEQDVLTRIPPIIECHFHGVWAAQLALDYEEQYGEQLPPNWLALLDTLPTIAVEPTLDNRYVLKVCKIGEKNGGIGNFSLQPNLNISTEVSVPSNKITLNADGWTVDVTFAASTVEVWCRIVGSDEANRYFEVNQHMQTYYNKFGGKERAINVSAGGFYVVQFDNCWSRVRVLSTGEHDVTCFFIDFGDEEVVSRSDMYDLKREFAREQAQAFVCRLSGLEELANMKAAQSRLETIAGKTYLAKPQLEEMDEPQGPEAISIILYGNESSDDADVLIENEEDINHLLMRQITYDSVPQLNPLDINLVYVSHATDKGDLFVQPQCEAFAKINELVSAVTCIDFDKEFPGNHISLTGSLEEDAKHLYLARWTQEEGDGSYYRCRVVDRSPCGQYVQLYFIDFGNTQIVNINNSGNIYPLEKISEVLHCFPPLAYRVRLDVELKTDKRTGEESGFAQRIMQLMPSDNLILLKINKSMIDEDGINVPVCEMFRRSDSRNELFSVSASLRYGRGLYESEEDGNNNDKTTQLAKKLERLRCFSGNMDNKPVPSTGELATPELPGPESFLDVRIPFAVNPWNFFVQPYSSAGDLLKLMEQLQERYGGQKKNDRVQLEDIIPGKIYAARHNDGVWYRTSVIKIINSGSISVFYCDVGYYANLTVEQLVLLDPEFLALPYQAIKARLAGIKPKDAKWSMDDCRHFEQLVRGKNFVSIVVAVQQDELYKCDAVLVLKLIDTSTEVDIHLDKLLIKNGIAAPAPIN